MSAFWPANAFRNASKLSSIARARIAIEGRPDRFGDRRQGDVLGVKSAVAIGEGTHSLGWLISAGNRGRTAASAARSAGSTAWPGRSYRSGSSLAGFGGALGSGGGSSGPYLPQPARAQREQGGERLQARARGETIRRIERPPATPNGRRHYTETAGGGEAARRADPRQPVAGGGALTRSMTRASRHRSRLRRSRGRERQKLRRRISQIEMDFAQIGAPADFGRVLSWSARFVYGVLLPCSGLLSQCAGMMERRTAAEAGGFLARKQIGAVFGPLSSLTKMMVRRVSSCAAAVLLNVSRAAERAAGLGIRARRRGRAARLMN